MTFGRNLSPMRRVLEAATQRGNLNSAAASFAFQVSFHDDAG
jgi:hypothetical protein